MARLPQFSESKDDPALAAKQGCGEGRA